MTLDYASEAFHFNPSEETAEQYLNTAAEYVQDGMIEQSELDCIHSEIKKWRLATS